MRIKIHLKITVAFCAIIACLLCGIYYHLNTYLKDHTFKRTRDRLVKETRFARSQLEKHFPTSYDYALDTIADTIGTDLDLRVTIIAPDGTVFGDAELDGEPLYTLENHATRPEIETAFDTGFGESRRFSTTLDQDMLYIAMKFAPDDKTAGVIRLSIALSDVQLITDELRQTLLISCLYAFLVMLVIGYTTSMFISNPIKKLTALAHAIASGNYTRRIYISTHDEIADLADSFNAMAKQIKHNIREITQNKSRLEAVFASMIDGIIVVDTKSTILLMNDAMKKSLHVEQPPEGKKTIEVIRNMEIQELIDTALSEKKKIYSREIQLLHPTEKILLTHATPVVRDNTTEGVVLVFHDITELRKLENIRKDFVANVSHELRTPIATIKGYAETLIDGALDDQDNAREFLNIIAMDADRLAQLINDILDLSKIESGKLELEKTPTPLCSIIDRVIPQLKAHIAEQNVTIHNNVSSSLPDVSVDPDLITQVLLNLIDNAIKYNKPRGTVTLSADMHENCAEISITDTGIGIPEHDIPRIFERFYRVDKAHSRHLGGTGLGLSIVKHIIHAHNGSISVESTVGIGTTIRVCLPV